MTFGLGTLMILDIPDQPHPVKGVFVGMIRGDCIIVQTPRTLALEGAIPEGTRMDVRYLYSGTVYGFKAQVKHCLFWDGLRLIFLSYPVVVEEHDLRKYNRIEFHLKATAVIEDKEYKGSILDISMDGCGFRVKQESLPNISVEDRVLLSFQFPGMPEAADWSGTIRNITIDKLDAKLGIQFDRVDEDMAAKIERFINSLVAFFD